MAKVTTQANGEKQQSEKKTVNLFYRNYMGPSYKVDEKVVKEIIRENVTCIDPTDNLRLTIFYKSCKTSDLLIRNSIHGSKDKLKRTNVVYQFSCPYEDCRLRGINYIGATSLSRRLTMHLREGAPKQHMTQTHQKTITRTLLTENTTIIKTQHNTTRPWILEALLIRQHSPQLNEQQNSCVTLGL